MANTMLDELKKHFEDPENVKAAQEYFSGKSEKKERNISRIKHRIEGLSDIELDTLFDKFVKWEVKLEEHYYIDLHIQTSSNILSSIISYVKKYGAENDEEYEDFLSGSWSYKTYKFKVYSGQGSFWRIEKDGKEIFTSK